MKIMLVEATHDYLLLNILLNFLGNCIYANIFKKLGQKILKSQADIQELYHSTVQMYFSKEDITPYLTIKTLIVTYFEVLWCLSVIVLLYSGFLYSTAI